VDRHVKEIARTAGRIEHADVGQAPEEIEERAVEGFASGGVFLGGSALRLTLVLP
jgi:hypothetical protein